MTFIAIRQAALLLLVVGGCLLLSRRFRVLTPPLAVTVAVIGAGVLASVIGAVGRSGWVEVPAVAWRCIRVQHRGGPQLAARCGIFIGGFYRATWRVTVWSRSR